MEEQKFKIGEDVYLTDVFSIPTKCRIVDYGQIHDPRVNDDSYKYCIYIPNESRLIYRYENQLYKTKTDAYIEMIRKYIKEGEEMNITVDEEYYIIKIKKGE